jgi:C1A family cysteine protease
MTSFAAMSATEYRAHLSYFPTATRPAPAPRPLAPAIPPFRNWTQNLAEKGIFFPVRDQIASQCISDWAFAAVDAVEYAWAVYQLLTVTNVAPLSAANLVQCADAAHACYGCYGGSISGAYRWIIEKQNGNFFTESDWPYKPENPPKSCYNVTGTRFAKTKLLDYWEIYPYSETDLSAQCNALGAVAAGIDASRPSFALYSGGIYEEEECSPYNVNHAVTVVGFGNEPKKYWIIKNSWGREWGEGGYMRLLWDKNHCGIATVAVAPVC